LAGVVVVPDRRGQCQNALQDLNPDAGGRVAAEAFEAELALKAWLTDSISRRKGRNSRASAGSGSPWRAGRNSRTQSCWCAAA
jgi:hypothetical protein